MTIGECAVYRYASRLMTPAELSEARELARKADAGDATAGIVFEGMVDRVLADEWRRQQQERMPARQRRKGSL